VVRVVHSVASVVGAPLTQNSCSTKINKRDVAADLYQGQKDYLKRDRLVSSDGIIVSTKRD
jgi:hypothetical protein